MNTALHASPPTESKQTAQHERDLSFPLPREEELRNLSLAQRVALRVALHLIMRTRHAADTHAHDARRDAERLRVLQEHEAVRLAYAGTRQVL